MTVSLRAPTEFCREISTITITKGAKHNFNAYMAKLPVWSTSSPRVNENHKA